MTRSSLAFALVTSFALVAGCSNATGPQPIASTGVDAAAARQPEARRAPEARGREAQPGDTRGSGKDDLLPHA